MYCGRKLSIPIKSKMSAPLSTCRLLQLFKRFPTSVQHQGARSLRYRTKSIVQEKEEIPKLKKVKRDPRTNPYVSYVPEDPIQRTLVEAQKVKKKRPNKDSVAGKKEKLGDLRGNRGGSKNASDKDIEQQQYAKSVLGISFERLNTGDKRFGQAILGARSKQKKQAEKLVVLEGRNLITDALLSGAGLKSLYFTDMTVLSALPCDRMAKSEVYKVRHKDLQLFTGLDKDHTQGLMGIFEVPKVGEATHPAEDPIPATVVFDTIKSPENMGTLIKTCAAVGCSNIITTEGCIDAWEGSVLRAGQGCHFRVPITPNVPWPLVNNYLPSDTQVFLVDGRRPTEGLLRHWAGDPTVLEKLSDRLGENAKYEGFDDTEEDEASGSPSDLDSDSISDADSDSDDGHVSNKNDKAIDYTKAPIHVTMYDEVNYACDHVTLVIGEEQGISWDARKLAFKRYGQCVIFPMENGVSSLNFGLSGSILLYEVLRQFRSKRRNSN